MSFNIMKMSYGDLAGKPRTRQSLTGVNPEEFLTRCPSLDFIIDGRERGINRPKHKESQKENYSGKQKTHTVKNNIITHMNGKVVFLSDAYEGKKHDKKIADEEEYKFPSGSQLGRIRDIRDISQRG